MTTLNKKEAVAILAHLNPVGALGGDINLLNAIVKLRMVSDKPTKFNYTISAYSINRISAIKAVRMITGFGLKEAKDFVDSFSTFDDSGVLLNICDFTVTSCNNVDTTQIINECGNVSIIKEVVEE